MVLNGVEPRVMVSSARSMRRKREIPERGMAGSCHARHAGARE
jgi:hypothetical protein